MLICTRYLSMIGILIGGAAAQAAVLTFAFEGPVTNVDDPLGLLGYVHVGDRVVYSFTFDSNAPDSNHSSLLSLYDGISASFLIGNTLLPMDPPVMRVQRSNMFEVHSYLTFRFPDGLYFRLTDDQDTAIPDTSLPLAPYDLGLFENRGFSVTMIGPVNPPGEEPTIYGFRGIIDSFYVVPEPISLLLMIPVLACSAIRFSALPDSIATLEDETC